LFFVYNNPNQIQKLKEKQKKFELNMFYCRGNGEGETLL
jgi:hypothetical protein